MTTPHRRDRLGICQNCGSGVTAIDLVDGALPCRRKGGAVMSDIDLTEAINAARLAWHAESDACGRGLGGPSAGELADAMIRAAAPIIARQVAERQQTDQKHCYPPGSAVPHVALCGATGEHMGQTMAEEHARGVCSVCHGRAMEITRRQAAAQALRRFADAHRMPLVMFTRDDGSAVSVGDLLREEADRIERSAHVTLRAGEPAHIARKLGPGVWGDPE